jgi:hypothetical protein
MECARYLWLTCLPTVLLNTPMHAQTNPTAEVGERLRVNAASATRDTVAVEESRPR